MKRTLLLSSAWTASAAAAVGLGFLAVSLVDASASPGTATVSTSSGGSPTAAAVTGSPTAAPAAGQQVTLGGTVYGSCENGVPVLASAPAAGWWLDDSNDVGEAEFENGTLKIEVKVSCVDGSPQFFVEGPRDESRHGGEDRTSAAPSAGPSSAGSSSSSSSGSSSGPTSSSSSSSSSGDDSDGRVGGGHGSDDSGSDDSGADDSGDDSSGRGGGGHGSDD